MTYSLRAALRFAHIVRSYILVTAPWIINLIIHKDGTVFLFHSEQKAW